MKMVGLSQHVFSYLEQKLVMLDRIGRSRLLFGCLSTALSRSAQGEFRSQLQNVR